MRALRKLLLGETWQLPVGVAVAVGVALLARSVLGEDAWRHAGGFVLLAGVIVALLVSVSASVPRR
jgi:hypothetical protein